MLTAQAFAIVIESGPADVRGTRRAEAASPPQPIAGGSEPSQGSELDRRARARVGRPPIASVTVAAGYPREVDGGDIAELKPGYWALVAGVCATRAEADAVLARLRGERFHDAYLKPTRSTAVSAPACPALRPAWDRAEQLVAAAAAGDGKRVRALVAAGADVNHVTGGGETALGSAAYGGREDAVRVLLAAGARPDVRGVGAQDETPLMLVARSTVASDPERIARLLIARGADVNATTTGAEADYGTSPLTEALAVCRPGLVRLLLAKRARVVIDGSRRRCGTPDYPAPDDIKNLLARIKVDLR